MSEAAKQRPPKTLEQRQAMGQRRLGCKHSEETKLKIGQSHKGLYKPPHTEETKQRISEKLKGRKREPFSDEHKEKISIAARNRGPEYREKLSRINKGKTLSEETRRKISESNKGQKRSEEFKQKLRGRVVSEETRQRIRDQNLNRPKQQYKVVFPNGDEQIVDNRQDFCVKHNLNYAMFGTRMSKGRDYNGLMIYKIPK